MFYASLPLSASRPSMAAPTLLLFFDQEHDVFRTTPQGVRLAPYRTSMRWSRFDHCDKSAAICHLRRSQSDRLTSWQMAPSPCAAAGSPRYFGPSRREARSRGRPMESEEIRELRATLLRLKQEHRDLDSAINALEESGRADALQLKRLKKKKLALKDEIARIEDQLLPDIIA